MVSYSRPSETDLARFTGRKEAFVDRLLSVIEDEIIPLTRRGVAEGNKVFGGAVLSKADLSTVVAVTNKESVNPLNHGEIATINTFYEVPLGQRPMAKDTIFLSTHEPCPLCLSALTWGGWDNFFYFFSYEDTKDAFNIPHDIGLHEEIWNAEGGHYNQMNHYWSSWHIQSIIDTCDPQTAERLNNRSSALRVVYDELSEVYQSSKGTGAEIPLD